MKKQFDDRDNAIGDDPGDLIAFANGTLNVSKFLSGEEGYLLEPTPDLFTTAAMPFPFDPTAECPEWIGFLESSLGDEVEKILLLQEWIGYCMTMDTSMQKMMFMRGPTGAGKGIVLNAIARLIGTQRAAYLGLADLCRRCGLELLIDKSVCLIGDTWTPWNASLSRAWSRVAQIVVNEVLSVERRGDRPINMKLAARITVASDKFLDLRNYEFLRRLMILEFKHAIIGQEDDSLPMWLEKEMPGIAVWALEGLRRLREQGTFTLPASSKEALQEWRLATNPLSAFIEECCDLVEGAEVMKSELYDAWTSWCSKHQLLPLRKFKFFEGLRRALPDIESDAYEKGGHMFSVYRGIRPKPSTSSKPSEQIGLLLMAL